MLTKHKVNEWVDPTTILVPVVEAPVVAAIEASSFVKKAHITESASDIRNLFGEIKNGKSKKKSKSFAKQSVVDKIGRVDRVDRLDNVLTADELEDMFASSKPGRAQAKAQLCTTDFVEQWNQLEPTRLQPAKPILKKQASPENLI